MVSQVLFWGAAFLILYTYFFYPVSLFLLGLVKKKKRKYESFDHEVSVSVVLAAYNEGGRIEKRLRNLVEQDYSGGPLEVILVVDGATDNTSLVAREFIDSLTQHKVQISLIELGGRQGKAHALNVGVKQAKGDIVVFSDCRQRFRADAISELVKSFADERVGCVSGELFFTQSESSEIVAEMGAYWKYEKLIRKLESKTGSVVGATGAIYAIRRELYRRLSDQTILDDVVTTLRIAQTGYEIVFNDKACAYDVVSPKVADEWRRKVRTLTGNWQLFSLCPVLFHPLKSKLFWRLVSHKICRLFVPFWMLTCFISAFVADGSFYSLLFWGQVAFYLAALSVCRISSLQKNKILGLIYFFCVLNGAVVVSFWYWASGRIDNLWTPVPMVEKQF